jgi:hypothetical protein
MSDRNVEFSLTVRRVERIVSELAPDPAIFTQHLLLVQDYVRARPGAHAALMQAAQDDPDTLTMSLVALGAVLLDIAAGAYKLTPEEVLDKLADRVARVISQDPVEPAL